MDSILKQTLQRIRELHPKYATRLETQLPLSDRVFVDRAERFLGDFVRFLASQGKDLNWGIDCHLKLCRNMIQERTEFLRSKRYASSSFAEVEQRVYANPEIMEYYMYGLVFAQLFWREQYARFCFFSDTLPRYGEGISSYLEVGGGHAMYISEAVRILKPGTHAELVDISPTSFELAKWMSPSDRIQYHLQNIFDFPGGRTYSFITAGEIIEHLEEPLKLLAKIHEMLTPDGRAFISTPVNAPTVDHIYLFRNVQEIRDLLDQAGFAIESEATCYAEDVPPAQAEKLKVAQMFASFVRKK